MFANIEWKNLAIRVKIEDLDVEALIASLDTAIDFGSSGLVGERWWLWPTAGNDAFTPPAWWNAPSETVARELLAIKIENY